MTEEKELLIANRTFYQAFANRDVGAMSSMWASEHLVACVHPGWHALYGREEVVASWRAILRSEHAPAIQYAEARAFTQGDQGFVVCIERVQGTELVATNVFTREPNGWKLVHHHAAPCSRKMPVEPPKSALN